MLFLKFNFLVFFFLSFSIGSPWKRKRKTKMINLDLPCVPVCWVPAFSPNQMTTIEKRTFQNSRHWKSTGKLHSQSFQTTQPLFFFFNFISTFIDVRVRLHPSIAPSTVFFGGFFTCVFTKERKKKKKREVKVSFVCRVSFFIFPVSSGPCVRTF